MALPLLLLPACKPDRQTDRQKLAGKSAAAAAAFAQEKRATFRTKIGPEPLRSVSEQFAKKEPALVT